MANISMAGLRFAEMQRRQWGTPTDNQIDPVDEVGIHRLWAAVQARLGGEPATTFN